MPGLIMVRDLLTCDFAICDEDGSKLHALIKAELDAGTCTPVVDFTGVTLAVPFLKSALGPFMEHMTRDDLFRKMTMTGLPSHGLSAIDSVLDHSNRWYHDAGYRDAVTRSWAEHRED